MFRAVISSFFTVASTKERLLSTTERRKELHVSHTGAMCLAWHGAYFEDAFRLSAVASVDILLPLITERFDL